ncbi:unnamed protein product [Diatraea saccharalis]|uniref:Uncharacterized protein n=1 Tax=Diatraea saccharalis TaxID=40085 RepID=A0A9N9QWK1_9NEOP|nr:unnamed protein product [Diatraea saccharalis]
MPLKRTPLKLSQSETDSESVSGRTQDDAGDIQRQLIPSRQKRRRENDYHEFMDEVRTMFNKFTAEQNNKLSILQQTITDIKIQNGEIRTSIELLSTKYDDVLNELETLKKERRNNNEYIYELKNKIESLERSASATKLEIRNI